MKIQALAKTYEARRVLESPELELPSGEICAVIGANGSGKSTFARVLAGVLPPDPPAKRVLEPCTVGYMPQRSYAFRMSARKNICLGGNDAERATSLMEQLDILHLADSRADRLSGGETARMALARVLLRRYDLVILDEPTAAMDVSSASMAESAIARYRDEMGSTVILVTHSLQQARRLCSHALFFHQGRLLESGPAKDVLYSPRSGEAASFLQFYGA